MAVIAVLGAFVDRELVWRAATPPRFGVSFLLVAPGNTSNMGSDCSTGTVAKLFQAVANDKGKVGGWGAGIHGGVAGELD